MGVEGPGDHAVTAVRGHPLVGASVDGAAMREVLGHFATGVVVVTAAGKDGPIGFTCQSFASLSLDPPLISLAPARSSSTWPRIREVGAFCVNVLADDHEHHSVQFARSGIDRFAGVRWTSGPFGAPILDGVAAWVGATLEHEYDGGDHTIVVGRVRALRADPARAPLLFHRGRYARLDGWR
jgi:3-hydroxy-9,10-secoandrosta-1,3,5(10)-triene-9,17-dione monooxygenase reductase component